MEINRVGTFTTQWGESLVWDERRSRLLFVDCGTQTIHWLDAGDEDPLTFHAPTMPTGVVPTNDGRFVVVMEDGLYLFDLDAASIGARCPATPRASAVGATTPAPTSTVTSSPAG